MFFRVLITSIALVLGVSSADAGVIERFVRNINGQQPVGTPAIKVLIVHDTDKALLQVDGKYALIDPHRHEMLARRVTGKQRQIEALPSGLKWGEEFPDIYQLKIVPTSPETIIYVNGVPYPGIIAVYDVGGSISIVNEVDIEDFVASMLASKVDRPIAKEALAAAAIAQRTDAYYRSSFPRNTFWDIDGIRLNYQGVKPQPHYDSADEAVDATSYMVMNLGTSVSKAENDTDDKVGLFPARWTLEPVTQNKTNKQRMPLLVLTEADAQATQGQNAAQILNRTFKGITIQRMFSVY